jgi:predicted PurR-regulated permease PerM
MSTNIAEELGDIVEKIIKNSDNNLDMNIVPESSIINKKIENIIIQTPEELNNIIIEKKQSLMDMAFDSNLVSIFGFKISKISIYFLIAFIILAILFYFLIYKASTKENKRENLVSFKDQQK